MKKRVWIAVLLIGIMMLTTVFYLVMLRNGEKSYANGKFVEQEEGYAGRNCIFKTGAEQSGC